MNAKQTHDVVMLKEYVVYWYREMLLCESQECYQRAEKCSEYWQEATDALDLYLIEHCDCSIANETSGSSSAG